ncbi:hypothetical protein C0989_009808 [Termitomyces sp. Mn162]|nr:hypothetical protein C0989_009808 [Termitomyces sp. Mn162]
MFSSPMSQTQAPVSLDTFNMLSALVSTLIEKMNKISIRLGSTVNATPVLPVAPSTEFIPPIPAGAANGMSPASISLHTWFPDIEAAVITAIIMHEF